MKILWLSWKDAEHPLAGGAEVVKSQMCQRLARDGHTVVQLTAGFKGGASETQLDGCKVIRVGGRYSVYWQAKRFYQKRLKGWADLVIDECNTVPFFAKTYVAEPNVLFINQLARIVWFYQMRFPIACIGYILEPIYLRMLSSSKIITISNSTKQELLMLGFDPKKISIIRMGNKSGAISNLTFKSSSLSPTLLYLGSLRPMKRPHHVIKAFILAKAHIPQLKLILAGEGEGAYQKKLMTLIKSSGHSPSIVCTGRVSEEEKIVLMKSAHLIVVTSVKEGWGLIVTEAAAQGTPAVVYDVDGLRDSVKHEITGLVTPCSPNDLADGIIRMLRDDGLYNQCRRAAWEWSKELTFENSYTDFCKALNIS